MVYTGDRITHGFIGSDLLVLHTIGLHGHTLHILDAFAIKGYRGFWTLNTLVPILLARGAIRCVAYHTALFVTNAVLVFQVFNDNGKIFMHIAHALVFGFEFLTLILVVATTEIRGSRKITGRIKERHIGECWKGVESVGRIKFAETEPCQFFASCG